MRAGSGLLWRFIRTRSRRGATGAGMNDPAGCASGAGAQASAASAEPRSRILPGLGAQRRFIPSPGRNGAQRSGGPAKRVGGLSKRGRMGRHSRERLLSPCTVPFFDSACTVPGVREGRAACPPRTLRLPVRMRIDPGPRDLAHPRAAVDANRAARILDMLHLTYGRTCCGQGYVAVIADRLCGNRRDPNRRNITSDSVP